MATTTDDIIGARTGKPTLAQFIDRWIYAIMAALFVAIALAGFVPDSIGKAGLVQAGIRPPFPLVLHLHAVLMGSWLVLLLAQATLMAAGKRAGHMQLGVAGMVLAPAMVLTGFWLVPTMVYQGWPMADAPPSAAPPWGAETMRKFLTSLVSVQVMNGVLFALFVAWAFLARKRDFGLHKRLMILATVVPLPAAVDRIAWLPRSTPESSLSLLCWPVVLILPMFLWDLYRLRRVHKAYLVWGAIYVPASLAVYKLWWAPGWIAFSARLLGVA